MALNSETLEKELEEYQSMSLDELSKYPERLLKIAEFGDRKRGGVSPDMAVRELARLAIVAKNKADPIVNIRLSMLLRLLNV